METYRWALGGFPKERRKGGPGAGNSLSPAPPERRVLLSESDMWERLPLWTLGVCACVCERESVCLCVYACVRVCVCERERERQRDTDRQTDRQTETDRERETDVSQ